MIKVRGIANRRGFFAGPQHGGERKENGGDEVSLSRLALHANQQIGIPKKEPAAVGFFAEDGEDVAGALHGTPPRPLG